WADRHAPRDLWDQWALSELGAIDADAAALFRRLGPPTNYLGPTCSTLRPRTPSGSPQLAGQTILTVTAAEALKAVREAWRQAPRPARTLINDD
ncbi:MAG: hypothetical protein QOF25_5150, partial [Mycobacterium sp.]|nr:hypothetical protein [Mycobacterium sp.]